jgi:nucleoside-diphosphate-sugar epimerase
MAFFQDKKILVTGGASFIGSHLVDALVAGGAQVRVVDNLSSGQLAHIQTHLDQKAIEFIHGDLLDLETARQAVRDVNLVFHLAADHGGRGYVDLKQVECASNLILDGQVIGEAHRAGVEKIVFASSGCVYPNHLQTNPAEEVYLTEKMVGPPYDSDNLYGWAKLMAEFTLQSYYHQHGLKSACCRYFTVYGPRGKENHAVIAMIARAFVRENPFEVWGTGEQVRNWTYVDDIVAGTLLAAEKIDDGRAVNLGTMERIRVVDAVKLVLKHTGHQAPLKFLPKMPTGPLNRVADHTLAEQLLGWKAEVLFGEGLKRTIDWYFNDRDRNVVEENLTNILIDRKSAKTPEIATSEA